MQTVQSAGKHANGSKCEKTCKRRKSRKNMQTVKARENMQTVQSPGKYANGTKPGKTCKRYKARENMQTVQSAENMQTMQSAGKHANRAKRGKTRGNRCDTYVVDYLSTVSGNYGCEIHGTTFFWSEKIPN